MPSLLQSFLWATNQEGISAKRLDANKAAQVDKVDALQVVKRQLIIEELRKLHDLILTHRRASPHLHNIERA